MREVAGLPDDIGDDEDQVLGVKMPSLVNRSFFLHQEILNGRFKTKALEDSELMKRLRDADECLGGASLGRPQD